MIFYVEIPSLALTKLISSRIVFRSIVVRHAKVQPRGENCSNIPYRNPSYPPNQLLQSLLTLVSTFEMYRLQPLKFTPRRIRQGPRLELAGNQRAASSAAVRSSPSNSKLLSYGALSLLGISGAIGLVAFGTSGSSEHDRAGFFFFVGSCLCHRPEGAKGGSLGRDSWKRKGIFLGRWMPLLSSPWSSLS